ncbi:MAG: AMP-binding protein [Bacteroidales bacterium]|nr:AMP-binding protein [Bacteroidales bacterium]
MKAENNSFLPLAKLLDVFEKHSENTALYVQGNSFSYDFFMQRISAIQEHIMKAIPAGIQHVGVISSDHPDTYASIFALWFSGKAYVPLNPLNPSERNREIIQQLDLNHILGCGETTGIPVDSFSKVINTKLLTSRAAAPEIIECLAEEDGYVLFTSGSSGSPKGVRISRSNIESFYNSYRESNPGFTPEDRFLQIYDISFDGSVPCWLHALCSGASVYTVPQDEIKYLYALRLMKEHKLTVLKMTPSTLFYLRPFFDRIELPWVRLSIFGGEALPVDVTEEWMKCIPGAIIQNAYGPTETTVDCLLYNFSSDDFPIKSCNGVVSLGKHFGDFEYAIVKPDGFIAMENENGELCLCGNQVMKGYWKDDERTDAAFISLEINGEPRKFYRTGDLVSKDADGFFMYHGRMDSQVQIQGYRVELGEIEKHARDYLGEINLAALTVSSGNGSKQIHLFVEDLQNRTEDLLNYLESRIPVYMMPSDVSFLEEFPRLANGKTDLQTLSKIKLTK